MSVQTSLVIGPLFQYGGNFLIERKSFSYVSIPILKKISRHYFEINRLVVKH